MKPIPFASNFTVEAQNSCDQPNIIYDENEQLSFLDQGGKLVPVISNIGTLTGTRTFTEMREASDADETVYTPCFGTMTKTGASGETTDDDKDPLDSLTNTSTHTFKNRESTDSDV